MTITLYRGSRGKGKTLTMCKDGIKYKFYGWRVLSNFHTTFSEYIDNSEILKLNKESELFNCVILIDELQIVLDSRNFSSKENKTISHFITQIRKRNIHILATAQYFQLVDIRFRQNLDCVVFPNYDPQTEICTALYFDLTTLEDFNAQISIKPAIDTFIASDIFNTYNTYEMLK